MELAVGGGGHVGLVTAACLAELGHRVRVQDVDGGRVERLAAGELPFYEPGLEELTVRSHRAGRLSFHTEAAVALKRATVAFLCVPTPNNGGGRVDVSSLLEATRAVARHASPDCAVVNRSTAPMGTARIIASVVFEERGAPLPVAVNPEFLAEGTAVRDFLAPDRLVVGVWEEAHAQVLRRVYEPILRRDLPPHLAPDDGEVRAGDVPFVVTSPPTAELIKYAANAFLAVRVSFINEIARIAEELGGDVYEVAQGIGLDHRIGPHFLHAGIGWGGSCFPKDIVALEGMARTRGLEARILRAANEVNAEQRRWVARKLRAHLGTLAGRRVALLGLAYKPGTDDLRDAPSVEIATELARLSVRLQAYDPMVKDLPAELEGAVEMSSDPLDAARGADAVVIVTEWAEFAQLDLAELRSVMSVPLVLDGRNLLDPVAARAAGLTYVGVGRPAFVDIPEGRWDTTSADGPGGDL